MRTCAVRGSRSGLAISSRVPAIRRLASAETVHYSAFPPFLPAVHPLYSAFSTTKDKEKAQNPHRCFAPFLFFTPSIRYGMYLLYPRAGMCVRQSSRVVLVIDSLVNFPCGSCHNKIMQLRSLVRQYHFLRQVRSLCAVIFGNLPRSL